MLKENPTEAAEMVDNDTFFSEDAPELAAGLDQTERENEPPPPVLPEYEAIVAQHSDFAGWITIGRRLTIRSCLPRMTGIIISSAM